MREGGHPKGDSEVQLLCEFLRDCSQPGLTPTQEMPSFCSVLPGAGGGAAGGSGEQESSSQCGLRLPDPLAIN